MLAIGPAGLTARTWHLDPAGAGDAPTIQAAIDSAATGDVIVLANGVYAGDGNRDLDYHGKAVVIQSENKNPELCIIDCGGSAAAPHRAVYCHSGEGLGSQLRGITIRNGYSDYGGGVSCVGFSSPIIDICRFSNNAALYGGAISCENNSSPEITACAFSGNSAGSHGGGIFCRQYASPLVKSCSMSGNSATYGGAISCMLFASPTISVSTLTGNTATYGGGLSSMFTASPRMTACTLDGNSAVNGGGISCTDAASFRLESSIIAFSAAGGSVYCSQCASSYLKCCDLYGNLPVNVPTCIQQFFVTGQPNMSLDPQFCGARGSSNDELQSDSPCAQGNHPRYLESCGLIGANPIGCGTISADKSTWGTIKQIYK